MPAAKIRRNGAWEIIGSAPPGTDGKTVLYGSSNPTTQGVDGDFYINTTSNTIFGPKSGTWPAGTSLVGPQGAQGAQGPQGIQGIQGEAGIGNTAWISGAGAPTGGTGNDSDYYLNTSNGDIYVKTSGAWNSPIANILGPQGPQGNTGAAGNTVLYGASNPTTEGVDGNFYINTTSNTLFGPKSGTWPTGTSLVGPTGPPGAGNILYGSSNPTTEGVDGDFYINTTSNTIFGPKSGTWPAGASLVGPQGPQGATGSTGAQGPAGAKGIAFAVIGPAVATTYPQRRYTPLNETFTIISISATVAPVTTNLVLQLLKDGSNWGTPFTLTAGSYYHSEAINLSALAGAYIQISFTSVGTTPAEDLTIELVSP